jgi:hypothetical protein
MVGSNKKKRKEIGLIQHTNIPFYNLTYEAFGQPKGQKKVRISKNRFWYLHEIKKRKSEIKYKPVSIDLFVSEENLEKTIENLKNNGAKNIKKIQHKLPLPIYCPDCEKKGTANIKLEDRYETKNHKVRIHYNHKDKSKHYVATYNLDTRELKIRGKTAKKEAIDIRKFYQNYWIQKFGTMKNGLMTLEFELD